MGDNITFALIGIHLGIFDIFLATKAEMGCRGVYQSVKPRSPSFFSSFPMLKLFVSGPFKIHHLF